MGSKSSSPGRRSRAALQSAGFTMIELMMSITLLAIGVTGIMAMQRIAVVSNQHSRNLAIATHIAQGWQEQLAVDGVLWNRTPQMPGGRDLGSDPIWLRQIETVAGGEWFQPAFDGNRDFGPGFDGLGTVVDMDVNPERAHFCTHVRLTWLYSDSLPVAGNGLIRAEVRVFWLRNGATGIGVFCDPDTVADLIGAAVDRYHFVYKTTAVREATAGI